MDSPESGGTKGLLTLDEPKLSVVLKSGGRQLGTISKVLTTSTINHSSEAIIPATQVEGNTQKGQASLGQASLYPGPGQYHLHTPSPGREGRPSLL